MRTELQSRRKNRKTSHNAIKISANWRKIWTGPSHLRYTLSERGRWNSCRMDFYLAMASNNNFPVTPSSHTLYNVTLLLEIVLFFIHTSQTILLNVTRWFATWEVKIVLFGINNSHNQWESYKEFSSLDYQNNTILCTISVHINWLVA